MTLEIRLTSPPPGPRLRYVLDVLCEWYGWSWRSRPAGGAPGAAPSATPSVALFYGRGAAVAAGDAPADPPSTTTVVRPHGLLEAPPGATAATLDWADYHGAACPTGLDPLAGIFFCLSLLPEYDPAVVDAHGRPPAHTHPLAARGLAGVPVADRLAAALARQLWRASGRLGTPAMRPEAAAATSDVDAPRALYPKPLARRLAGIARAGLGAARARHGGGQWSAAAVSSWLRGSADPYDTFAYMHAEARARGLREDIFSLIGYGTRLDPGFPAGHPAWVDFWRGLPPATRLGIHPSYQTSERPALIAAEVEALRRGSGREIVSSRQHFLRLRLPTTYRTLIECGIREDHTLMWPDRAGFRAGSARSFPWYDLRREEATSLRLVPPHAMDVTARYYGGLSPKLAVAQWTTLARECAASGTALRCIWHNSNLGPWHGWWPWRKAFEASLDLSAIP